MRPQASIYSHRVPRFMETRVGFNPIQKRNSNPKRKLQPRLPVDRPVRSTGPCHGRLAWSTAPTRERGLFSRSTGPGRPLLLRTPMHAGRPASSTGRPGGRPGVSQTCFARRFSFLCLSISVLSSSISSISSISSLPQ